MKYSINIGLLVALFATLYIVFSKGVSNYELLSLLPLSAFLFLVFMGKILLQMSNYLVIYLFLFQIFIRYVLSPLFMISSSSFSAYESYSGNIAVGIMIVELVTLGFSLFLFRRFNKLKPNSSLKLIPTGFFTIVILLSLFLYILSTGYFNKVHFIWNILSYKTLDLEEITPLGYLLFLPFRFILLLFLTSRILKLKNKSNLYKTNLILLLIFFNLSIINGTSRLDILFFSLPLIILIIELYPSFKKRILVSVLTLMMIAIVISTLQKFTTLDESANEPTLISANSLNAYFSGVTNIAIGVDMYDGLSNSSIFILNDYIQNIPVLSKYANFQKSTNTEFNRKIYNHTIYQDQIAPLSIYSLVHFSYFGIWIYIFMFSLISVSLEKIAKRSKSIIYKYYYLAVIYGLLFMLLFSSVLFMTIVTIVFVLPFCFILKKSFSKNILLR